MTDAILLINLGSPASTSVADVRSYLNEFLMDPLVLDVPWLLRRIIVSGFILPRRPKQSAAAYRSIWGAEGSPLISNTRDLADALQTRLGIPVGWAMRYGSPTIGDSLEALVTQGATRVLVAPLYPQYAMSTTRTSFVAASSARNERDLDVRLEQLPPFHSNSAYLQAMATVARPHLAADFDHLLFSYHGLPERHLRKTDPTGSHCLASASCCETPSPAHSTCYRQQCQATSRDLAGLLGLPEERWSQAYQSRLGRGWLTPFTDEVLTSMPGQGIKRLVVMCPAFVADNLETLEEIGDRGRKDFLAAGGEELRLVPCLNAEPAWIDALASITSASLQAIPLQPVPSTA